MATADVVVLVARVLLGGTREWPKSEHSFPGTRKWRYGEWQAASYAGRRGAPVTLAVAGRRARPGFAG